MMKNYFLHLIYCVNVNDDIFDGELSTQEVFDVVSPYGYPGILFK